MSGSPKSSRSGKPPGGQIRAPAPAAPRSGPPSHQTLALIAYTTLFGLFLGLCLLKLGNPVILDDVVRDPSNAPWLTPVKPAPAPGDSATPDSASITAWLTEPWPLHYGIWILAGLVPLGLAARLGQWKPPPPFFLLPLIWFAWQLVSASQSVQPRLTQLALLQFAGCLACLALGWFVLSRCPNLTGFWIGITIGLVLVFWFGFNQHYGGLEAMRRHIYEQSDWQQFPPEFLRRIAKGRIFSTLVYPNALAGVVLLLLPPCLTALTHLSRSWPNVLRGVLLGLLAYAGLACLVWSGSKAGWLIALALGLVTVFQWPLRARTRQLLFVAILVLGLCGFLLKFSQYLAAGATSVGARFEYWRAAITLTAQSPWLGSGPGTFSVGYRQIKPPDAEMARLAHNDYLEQAADSGLPGFLAYTAFIAVFLWQLQRRVQFVRQPLPYAVWLGLLGWSLQGLVEFGLYIPALAWPAFTLFGWLGAVTCAPPDMASTPFPASDKLKPT